MTLTVNVGRHLHNRGHRCATKAPGKHIGA